MNDLRPDIICLVDAFDIHDSVLASTIGRKDGIFLKSVDLNDARGTTTQSINATTTSEIGD